MKPLLTTLLLTVAAISCRSIETPPGYLPLETFGELTYVAVAPNGNRIEIREHDNREEGTAEYWAQAIQRELVEGRGYSLESNQSRLLHTGTTFHELLFSTEHQLREYLYLVAIYASSGEVQILEAGGERESLEPDLPVIRQMLDTID
ncbi:MAG: hypothetical protein RL885_20120 [Planctomycetota bacterium]